MIRTPSNKIYRLIVAILYLMAGVALSSTSVNAQAERGAQKPREHNSTPSQKEATFEVTSIRPLKSGTPGIMSLEPEPNGYHSRMAVWQLIKAAYVPGLFENWENTPLLNAPKWLYENGTNYYDFDARVSKGDTEAWQHQGPKRELLRSALRALLKERCKLVIHMQPKEVPDYKLVIAKRGHKMLVNAPDPKLTPYGTLLGGGYMAVTKREGRRMLELYIHGVTMEGFCAFLSTGTRFPPIHDETGLTGRYDFKLSARDRSNESGDEVTIWQLEPLGLKLKPGKYQGFSIIIDHQ